MARMTKEEIKATGVKKGSKIKYTNTTHAGSKVYEGTVTKQTTKTKSGGKYFCGARNRWVDVGPVKVLELTIFIDKYQQLFLEDTFYTLEVLN